MADYLQFRPSGYYFRYTLPAPLRRLIGKSELKYALKTSSRIAAKSKATYIAASLKRLPERFKGHMAVPDNKLQKLVGEHVRSILEQVREEHTHMDTPLTVAEWEDWQAELKDNYGHLQDTLARSDYEAVSTIADHIIEKNNIRIDSDSDKYRVLCKEVARGMQQLTKQVKRIADGVDTADEYDFFASTEIEAATGKPDDTSSPLLSEVIATYCSEKQKAESWSSKTEAQVVASLVQAVEILTDIPIGNLKAQHARLWKDTLLALPPNYNKLPKFRDLSALEAAKLNEGPTISINTFNSTHTRVNAFFKWAFRHGHTDRNFFDGLKLAESKRAKDKRAAFSDDDLLTLFSTPQYIDHSFKHPHYYWIPLLGLHTGARLEELCQLYLDDIQELEGIWCFSIGDSRSDQKTKTEASNRIVPIHSNLIELGLLDYVTELQAQGAERLFPELKRQRDGYSQAVSKWFGRYREKLGMVNLTPKKDFHSFRHTLATRLKQADIPESVAGAIVGHTTADGITYGRYGKDYLATQVEKAVERVDFVGSLAAVKPYCISMN